MPAWRAAPREAGGWGTDQSVGRRLRRGAPRASGDRQVEGVRIRRGTGRNAPDGHSPWAARGHNTGHDPRHPQAGGPPLGHQPGPGAGPQSPAGCLRGLLLGTCGKGGRGLAWTAQLAFSGTVPSLDTPARPRSLPAPVGSALRSASWPVLPAGFTCTAPFLPRIWLSLQVTFCTLHDIIPPLNLRLCRCSDWLRLLLGRVRNAFQSRQGVRG